MNVDFSKLRAEDWLSLQGDQQFLQDFYQLTIEQNPYIPKRTPASYPLKAWPKQIEFLTLLHREGMFGGAARGGKSESLFMGANQFMHIARGYHALILRNASPDHKQADGLVMRSHEWYDDLPKDIRPNWNEVYKTWTFPNGNTLRLGVMDLEKDKLKFRGGSWQFVGFDELTLFAKSQYTYLFSRQSKPPEQWVPLRMRSATNPGGKGHAWVRERFVKPGHPSRPFIPAFVDDNLSVDVAAYKESLSHVEYHERKQLLEGSWDDFVGGRFLRPWLRKWTAIRDPHGMMRFLLHEREAGPQCEPRGGGDPKGIPCGQCWTFVTVDPAASVKAASDYTVIGVFGVTPWRDLLVLDMVRDKMRVEDIIPRIAEVCADYSPMWVGIEDNGFQVMLKDAARKHPGIPSVRGLKHEGLDKLVRATPAINYAAEGHLYFPPHGEQYPWVDECIAELVQFTGDPKQDAHDDVIDVIAYAVRYLDKFGLTRGPMVVQAADTAPMRIGYDDGYRPSGFVAAFGR